MKKFTVRAIRKSASITKRVTKKAQRFSQKVEDKTTRMLDGVDYSTQIDKKIPFEKIYYNNIPEITPLNPAMPAIGATPTTTLLIPTLDGNSFFGGTATALVVAAKISLTSGKRLRIVQTLKTGHPHNLDAFFEKEGVNIKQDDIHILSVADRAYSIYGYISIHPDDIFIASAWWDAHLIQQLPLTKRFIYLIQDFEPIFYNNSDRYVLAEETYKKDNYVALCNTSFMKDFMSNREYPVFKDDALVFHFEPAVSRIKGGLINTKDRSEKKKLFLYGRPNVHRNMFYTALSAINKAFESGFLDKNEWECYMAGQSHLPNVELPCRVTVSNLGKMSLEDYINFSKTVDLAISPMMAPHPNYPTLEFSSIGTSVVTTKYANKTDLSKYSDNIVMSDMSDLSMAGAIKIAAEMPRSKRTENAKKSNIPTSWDDSLNSLISRLLSAL